jgi:SAM-dependent methyltransferase
LAKRDLIRNDQANVEAVAIDFSPAMLEIAGKRFAGESSVSIVTHNLDHPLPTLGKFDAVVSCFAIHHLLHERKLALYAEIHALLNRRRCFLQSGARSLADATVARRVPAQHRLLARNRRSVQQVAGS